jgi:subtilase family serine protease
VWLKRNNQAQLKQLLHDIYTPGSPHYGKFLTTTEYNAKFGPTQANAEAVKHYYLAKGFTLGTIPSNRAYIPIKGSVAQFNQEFQVKINNYYANSKNSYSNDRAVTLNSGIAAMVDNITGLSNLHTFKPNTRASTMQPQSGSMPALYMPQLFKKAYGIDKLASNINGSGQTIAIVDAYEDPSVENDLNTFNSRYGLSACTTANGCFSKLNQNGLASPLPPLSPADDDWTTEISLDTQSAHSLAPGAKIVLYETNSNNNQDLYAALTTIVSNNSANVISNSWGAPEFLNSEATALEATLEEAQAKGISVNFSTGDNADMKQYPNFTATIEYPAASPHATAVGATALLMTSDGRYKGETGWAWPWADKGSTGGLSQYYTAPSWQQQTIANATAGGYGVVGTKRAVPDISMIGDPNTGLIIYNSNHSPAWFQEGGTSLSCPLFSALLALANQSLAQHNKSPVGLAAPYLYQMTYSVHQGKAPLTNVVAPQNTISSVLSAGPGWNDITGLGTPYAPLFIQWLINNK